MRLEGLLASELATFAGGDLNLTWAAVRSDGFVPPPLEHLLDAWLRSQLSETEISSELREAISARPVALTISLDPMEGDVRRGW